MRTKLIYSNVEGHDGFGAGPGNTERYEYECPCGKGKIKEEHDNIPGFRDHFLFISCDECRNKYDFDTSQGSHSWELVEKTK